jgi:adenosylhomocysteine nucleosidase
MQSEAECLDALTRYLPLEQRPYIHCAGPGPERAAIACKHIEKQIISGIASIGVAGGLDPALIAGTLLVPAAIVTSDNQLVETDSKWRAKFSTALPSKPPSTLHMGMDVAVANPKDKEGLFREYKAHAVDMESHILGEYAKQRGMPFIIIRTVADTAKDAIPEAALAGLSETGNVLPFQVIRRLVPNPGQLPALLQLARDSRAAINSLKTIPKTAIEVLCRIEGVD